MNELETLHKNFNAFLVEHHVKETMDWAVTHHPVLSLAMAVVVVTTACVMVSDLDRARNPPATPTTPATRRPWFTRRKLDPLPAPQPIEPAAIVYGAQRQLIQRQRTWMAEMSRAQVAAQLDGNTMKATALGFADWFATSVATPDAPADDDVIPHNVWVADYHAYCDEHNAARFSDGDLHAHMLSYAHSYHCTLDQQGNFHGGYITR